MLVMCRAKEVEGVGRKRGAAMMSLTAGIVVADEGDTDSESAYESDDDREGGGVGSIWTASRWPH